MFYVYLLQSTDKEKRYIGWTADLQKRLSQHNDEHGDKRRYTHGKKWNLVYYESFLSEKDAKAREKRLKHNGNAKYQLMKRIENSLKK